MMMMRLTGYLYHHGTGSKAHNPNLIPVIVVVVVVVAVVRVKPTA